MIILDFPIKEICALNGHSVNQPETLCSKLQSLTNGYLLIKAEGIYLTNPPLNQLGRCEVVNRVYAIGFDPSIDDCESPLQEITDLKGSPFEIPGEWYSYLVEKNPAAEVFRLKVLNSSVSLIDSEDSNVSRR